MSEDSRFAAVCALMAAIVAAGETVRFSSLSERLEKYILATLEDKNAA